MSPQLPGYEHNGLAAIRNNQEFLLGLRKRRHVGFELNLKFACTFIYTIYFYNNKSVCMAASFEDTWCATKLPIGRMLNAGSACIK